MGDTINSTGANTARTDQWTEVTPAANEGAARESAPAPRAESSTPSSLAAGWSHGFLIEGMGGGGAGIGISRAHDGAGVRLAYYGGTPVVNGGHRFLLHPILGAQVSSAGAAYMTPGGEPVSSAYTMGGLLAGLDARYVPNGLEHRLSLWAGFRLIFGGFGTAESKSIDRPQNCVPGDFGRPDCEPTAGSGSMNAGTQGLFNFDAGSSRGTSGIAFYLGLVPAGVSVALANASWGNARLSGGLEVGYMYLSPSDGHAFGHLVLGGALNLTVNVGGSAVEAPREETPQPQVSTQNVSEQPPSGEPWNVDSLLQSQLPTEARIGGVTFDGHAVSGPPYVVPASSMTPGNHTLRATYRMPGEDGDRVLELRITSSAPQPLPQGEEGGYGIEHTEDVYRKRR